LDPVSRRLEPGHRSSTTQAARTDRRRGALRWRLCLVLACVLPFVAELALRGTLAWRGAPYSRAEARAELARMTAELGAPMDASGELQKHWLLYGTSLHPYYGFESSRGTDEIAAQAQLARQMTPEQRAQRAIVLVLGGSVADYFGEWGFGPLQQALDEDPRLAGREIVLLRHGRPAFKAPQPLLLCTWLFELGIVPDLVVLIDGFNEVALANYNASVGVHPAYPSIYHWGALARGLGTQKGFDHALRTRQAREQTLETATDAVHALGGHGLRSALYGTFALRGTRRMHEHWKRLNVELIALVADGGRDPITAGPPFDPQQTLAIAVDTWERQSRALDALCDAFGARFLHVLQPTLHDADSKPVSEQERESGFGFPAVLEGARAGYPLLRERIPQLRERGIDVYDASRIFAERPETLYFDQCHFGRAGNAIFAQQLAPHIGARLALR
jgi:hypothetical protein